MKVEVEVGVEVVREVVKWKEIMNVKALGKVQNWISRADTKKIHQKWTVQSTKMKLRVKIQRKEEKVWLILTVMIMRGMIIDHLLHHVQHVHLIPWHNHMKYNHTKYKQVINHKDSEVTICQVLVHHHLHSLIHNHNHNHKHNHNHIPDHV